MINTAMFAKHFLPELVDELPLVMETLRFAGVLISPVRGADHPTTVD